METAADKSWDLLVEGHSQLAVTLKEEARKKYCDFSHLAGFSLAGR